MYSDNIKTDDYVCLTSVCLWGQVHHTVEPTETGYHTKQSHGKFDFKVSVSIMEQLGWTQVTWDNFWLITSDTKKKKNPVYDI